MRTSARNQFPGTVVSVAHGAVLDEVVLRVDEGFEIVASITQDSATRLRLEPGRAAFALIKASSVIVMVDVAPSQVSARNVVAGTLSQVKPGVVTSEVVLTTAAGTEVVATVTQASAERMGLAAGRQACAIFKASSVIVGVDD
ncbi:TOBE domain-containing protein [Chitinasiproducens palmae]|uniref:Molybdenum-pterin binding domain-containing protein n=1 Tax=Chitinasiproducens palmae TaxID=1770053 RepID=A0A1H2PK18_9BURK|nr:TOBE domain-containing protein [Chitinasiproducens palmae]SDV46729.1 molybdenum-pterin binding domain-containing protein [Chitinasiproducens palmae]